LRWLAKAAFKRTTGLYYRDIMRQQRDMMGQQRDITERLDAIQHQATVVLPTQITSRLDAIQHQATVILPAQVEAQGEVMYLLLRRLRLSGEEVAAHLGTLEEQVAARLSTLEEQVATQLLRSETTQDALRSDLSARLAELHNPIHLLTPLALASTMYWTVSAEDALGDNELVMSKALSNFHVRFQDRHRGSEELIRERQRPLLAYFGRCQRVLDIGCGRGEFLELLREQHIPGEGIDINPSAVDMCRAKGGTAHQAEALAYLSSDGAGTFDGIHMNHLIEHLPFPTVVRLLEACLDQLQPGGVLVAQTPNPYCPETLQAFFVDPTHVRPLFPDAVTVLLESLGFEQVEVHFVTPVREEGGDRPQRGPQDFAEYFVVAVKPPVQRPTTSARKQAGSSKPPRKRRTSAKRR
jgi:O-antigen chain-terminating methyltransferase